MNVQKITFSPNIVRNNGENKKLNSNPIQDFKSTNLVGLDSLSAYNQVRFISPISFGEAAVVVDDDEEKAINYDVIVPTTEAGRKSTNLQKALYNGLYNIDRSTLLCLTNSDFVATATRYTDLIEGQFLDPDAEEMLLVVDERINYPIFFEYSSMHGYNMIMPSNASLSSHANDGLDISADYEHVVPVFSNDKLKINEHINPITIYNQGFLDKNHKVFVEPNDRFVFKVNIDNFLDDQDVDFLGISALKAVNELENVANVPASTEVANVKPKVLKPLFSDVGGQKEVIQKIEEEILFPLIHPDAFGHVMNKGAILCGPPGTGKTYIARALANEVSKRLGEDVKFINLDGNVLNKSEVGKTEENWRDAFKQARESQPCIIFIDEGDAFTQARDGSSNARYDNKTVNQILTLMSELEESDDKVFVIMATNRLEMMDSAITRDGRFGVIIDVDLPNKDGCREIFDIHMRNKNPDENLDRDYIAQLLADKKTSGATIAGVIERAFKYSYRRCGIYDKMRAGTFVIDDLKDVKITMEDIKNAIDEVGKNEKLKKGSIKTNPIGFATNKRQ